MKFGLLYTYQGWQKPDIKMYADSLEQLKLAENYEFSSLWLSEHHLTVDGYLPAVFPVGGWLAANTKKLLIGLYFSLPWYHPLTVAENAAVLDIISGGRVILALGQGSSIPKEFDAFGIPIEERASRLVEGVEIIRQLFTKPSVTYQGKYYKLSGASLTPRPLQKSGPPIWIAASAGKEKTLRRVARIGEGWAGPALGTISDYKKWLEIYSDALKEFRADISKVKEHWSIVREFYVAENSESANEDARAHISYIYRGYWEWVRKDHPDFLEELDYDSLKKDRFIIGSVDECISEIEKYKKELNVENIILRIAFPGMRNEKVLNAIKLAGEKVIPHLTAES